MAHSSVPMQAALAPAPSGTLPSAQFSSTLLWLIAGAVPVGQVTWVQALAAHGVSQE